MNTEMQYQQIANQIFAAIDIIVDKKLEALSFDRCIVAEIMAKKADKNIYYCKFQDQKFWAQPGCAIEQYPIGSSVYVLVPQNNFKYDKIIIGLKGVSKN